jgi:hypothetical protein
VLLLVVVVVVVVVSLEVDVGAVRVEAKSDDLLFCFRDGCDLEDDAPCTAIVRETCRPCPVRPKENAKTELVPWDARAPPKKSMDADDILILASDNVKKLSSSFETSRAVVEGTTDV